MDHCNVVAAYGSWLCCCSAWTMVILMMLLHCVDPGDIDDVVVAVHGPW